MANTNTDLTEEDAADLQFPKERSQPIPIHNENVSDLDYICFNCSCELAAPYIFCVKCKVDICTTCFSNGVEFDNHKNNHNYQIIRDDFALFPNSDWTAKEEVTLLESLLRYGNWNLVAQELPVRTVAEIKRHYDYMYLERKGSKLLPEVKETAASVFPEPVTPYRFLIKNTDEPPRYTPNTIGYKYLAGYNPARSDFENEFDTNAEDLLSNLKVIDENEPEYNFISNLQCAIIRSYNRRLQERQRWKRIIRDHGLIVLRKAYAWLHRYDLTITKPVYEKLIRFMQLCTPFKFQLLMEGLHRSGELKIQILKLCDLRLKGITTLADARLYLKLKPIREIYEKEVEDFRFNSKLKWKTGNRGLDVDLPVKKKSGFTPIEIVGMPGYEKLTPKERDLCRNVRLVPITYLELKELLIAENKKMGSIKLKTARKMLKIDVNKTRRLFDFLLQEGYITKASP